MSLSKDISKFFEKASYPIKIRADKNSTGSLTAMADDVFAKSLKSPGCI